MCRKFFATSFLRSLQKSLQLIRKIIIIYASNSSRHQGNSWPDITIMLLMFALKLECTHFTLLEIHEAGKLHDPFKITSWPDKVDTSNWNKKRVSHDRDNSCT